jgi:hypothetical protein
VQTKRSKILRQTPTQVVWEFVCEACGEQGELTLEKADGMQAFGCPEGCGATYVPWTEQGRLVCVCRPVFAKERA